MARKAMERIWYKQEVAVCPECSGTGQRRVVLFIAYDKRAR